jgi:uncharacterized membrane protein
MAHTVLPALLDKASSINLYTRHGAVLAIAEILHALAIVAEQSDHTIQNVIGKILFFSIFCSIALAPLSLYTETSMYHYPRCIVQFQWSLKKS